MDPSKSLLPSEVEIALRSLRSECDSLTALARTRGDGFLIDDLGRIQQETDRFHRLLSDSIGCIGQGGLSDSLLRDLRHDLTNPLNPIMGYSEMLIEDSEDLEGNPYAPGLIRIRSAGKILLKWVNEGFSRQGGFFLSAPSPNAESESREVIPYQEPEPDRATESARVLLVEDQQDNRELLERLLARIGCIAAPAESGERALEILAEESFDLVLLDIGLPGISGFHVLENLRASYSPAELPVIMATALDDSDEIVRAFDLGANDYVTKPFDKAVVLARVRTQISLKKSQERIRNLVESLELRNLFIRETFGRYVPDEVVEELLSQPEALALEGQRRKVTILMSDLRGFTSMSERIPPEKIVKILNIYLGAMVGVIDEFKGTIDEFVGDAILVIFGAPRLREDDAERAVACALAMQEAMTSVNRQLAEKGLPTVEMGIGINTGEVVVGNIGSLERAKYGVIGLPVNLASRIESYTVGGQVLISENTFREIAPLLAVRRETAIRVKGFGDPITFYEVTGIRGRYRYSAKTEKPPLVRLDPPAPVVYSLLEGKSREAEERRGFLLAVSAKEALLAAAEELEPFSNLELNLLRSGGDSVPGDLYGKVLSAAAQSEAGALIRFTDVPETVGAFIQELIQTRSKGGDRVESRTDAERNHDS